MNDLNGDSTTEKEGNRQEKREKYEKILRSALLIFIVFTTGIAIFNELLYASFSSRIQEMIEWSYFLIETVGRAVLVYIGAIGTIKIIKISKKELTTFRKISLSSFTLVMTIFLLIIPLLLDFAGFAYLLMPFPWSTAPFQILETGAYFGQNYVIAFGDQGITYALRFYIVTQIIIFLGIVLFGREGFCSMLCPFNGCHAATLGEVLPFFPHTRKPRTTKKKPPNIVSSLRVLQWIFFPLHIGLMVAWSLYTVYGFRVLPLHTLLSIELVKYLIFGLLFMMIGWVSIGGRTYCYYCPAGTFLGLISRATGQKIRTDDTNCIECGSCNDACPMTIQIKRAAVNGEPVKSINCIGCRSCVEACPTGTLQYTTPLLDKFS